MKHTLKRLTALLLTLSMALSMLQTSALAAQPDAETASPAAVDEITEPVSEAADASEAAELPPETEAPEASAELPEADTSAEAPAGEPEAAEAGLPEEVPEEAPAAPAPEEAPAEAEVETMSDEEPAVPEAEEAVPEEETESAEPETVSATYISPLMEGTVTEEDLIAAAEENQKKRESAGEVETYATYSTSYSGMVKSIRNQMKARKSSYTYYYRTKSANMSTFLDDLLDDLYAHTGNPTEGDYLSCNVDTYINVEYRRPYSIYNNTPYYMMKLTCTFTNRDSAAQENQVNQAVQNILTSINTPALSDYDKVRVLYDTLQRTADYYSGTVASDTKYTPYAVFYEGSAASAGFAATMYRILLACGIDCRVVNGTSVNTTNGKKQTFIWNIVQMDGTYYNLDCSSDAGEYHTNGGQLSHTYFLFGKSLIPSIQISSEFSSYPVSYSSYTVSPYNISSCSVQLSQTRYTYAGRACTPSVTVSATSSGVTLIPGVDYTVTYSNNNQAGVATVTVRGTGSYYGSASRTFQILPQAISLTGASNSSNGVYLTWKKSKGATNYILYRKAGSATSWTKLKTLGSSATSYTDTNAKSKNGTLFAYTVRPVVVTSSGSTINGSYSKSGRKILRLATSKLSSAKNVKGKKMTVKWAKNNKSTGYQVQYSYKSNFSSKKTVTLKGASRVSATLSKLSKGKTCYVRVRSYRITGGKTYYSGWSNVGHAKISK